MRWQGLLVSVRDASEAVEALSGGADVIDVKEPLAGPLGAASPDTLVAVATCLAGERPWTFAAGELAAGRGDGVDDLLRLVRRVRDGIGAGPGLPPAAVKAGLSGLRDGAWRESMAAIARALPEGIGFVGVAYADHRAAVAPPPDAVIEAAREHGCAGVLVDTFDKDGAGLFGIADTVEVGGWVEKARALGLPIALAGRLSMGDVVAAVECGADVVAVRSLVCGGAHGWSGDGPGTRTDAVNRDRVRAARARYAGTPRGAGISSG